MSNKNKDRGKYFENQISEKIRLFLNIKKKDLHRNFESGNAKIEYGDIYLPFNCVIECKYHKSWTFNTLMKENKQIKDWIQQLDDAVAKYIKDNDLIPLKSLIISKPYENIYVFLDYEFLNNLNLLPKFYIKHNDLIVVLFDQYLDILKDFIRIEQLKINSLGE